MNGSTSGHPELKASIEQMLYREAYVFGATVPRANHLTCPDEVLDREYYLRHRIETVRRIRETSRTDALALAAMVAEDYAAARLWADYVEEEMNHDQLYLADLERHGLSEAVVLAVPSFPSTQRMVERLSFRIAQLGSLPAVAYSLLTEWNSSQASLAVIERAAAAFSPDHVKGARAHVGIDVKDSHFDVIVQVANSVLRARGYAPTLLDQLMQEIASSLREYFLELHLHAMIAASWRDNPTLETARPH